MFDLPPLLAHLVEIVFLLAGALIATGVGLRLLRLLELQERLSLGERLVFAIGLGYGVLAFAMLAMGLIGIIYLPVGLAVLAVLAAIAAAPLLQVYRPAWMAFRRALAGLRYPPNAVLATVILLAVLAALSKALVPVATQDDLMYHLALPRRYIDDHAVRFYPDSTYSLFPQLMEMLYTWSLLLGSDRLAELFAFSAGLIGPVAAGLFAKRYLAPSQTGLWLALPLFVAALYLTTPLVAYVLRAANTDLAQASFDMLALYAFCLGILDFGFWILDPTQHPSGDPKSKIQNPRSLLLLAGLCAGLSFSVKYYGFTVGLCLGLALLALFVAARVRRAGPGLPATSLLYFGLPALAVAAPWLVRNFIAAGNPVWPLGGALFGGAYWSRDASPEELLGKAPGLGLDNMWTALDYIRYSITRGPWAIGGQEHVVSLGPLLIPALVALPLAVWRAPLRWVAYAAGSYWLLWAFFFSRTSARYLSSFYLFAALLGGYALISVAARSSIARWALTGVVGLALGILAVDAALSTGPYLPTALALDRSAEQYFLSTYMDDYPIMGYIAHETPPSSVIYVWDGQPRGYYIGRPYVYARLVPLYSDFAGPPDAWRARLAQLGITHVLVHTRDFLAPGQPIYEDPQLADGRAFATRYFGKQLMSVGDYSLYALR